VGRKDFIREGEASPMGTKEDKGAASEEGFWGKSPSGQYDRGCIKESRIGK
jgi:hypothetical protein